MENLKSKRILIVLLGILVFPMVSNAQELAGKIGGLHAVLEKVYDEMIPLCSGLIAVARGIAGFGALWYIASRVWSQIASAEPIDFYPLLRPFALGLAIVLFPALLSVFNGMLQPTVSATGAMVKDSNLVIKELLKRKEAELKKSVKWKMYVGEDGGGSRSEWYKYSHPKDPNGSDEGWMEAIGNDIKFWADRQDFKMRHSFKQFMNELLELVYQAAALCINTLRTFFLIVLAILGPLVLGFAVFDGLQHTLSVWVARYINIFLWLPIANIFGAILGKIQQNMIKLDINEVAQNGDTFFSSQDTAYMIFMLIGIVGYFCVPTVANYVVHAGGGNSVLTKVNSMAGGMGNWGSSTGAMAGGLAASGAKRAGLAISGMVSDAYGDGKRQMGGMAETSGQDYFKDKLSGDSK
ncbi:Bacteroides conjugative transposon TraJ protein [Pedobacter suwonensis]|uniref:Bacteroides conjugative transposon TraJ protein n=1 Tax=Pedobacter suwonensis TaxID=332999 RepID=A0A1I0U3A5_9SPHI|nr:conjugative transposon protein TraJ [Pedobacter suwonensis]SFA58478.1 Bacteroides conjugative transposon TraJ protein [Pedobacter suwonensis]